MNGVNDPELRVQILTVGQAFESLMHEIGQLTDMLSQKLNRLQELERLNGQPREDEQDAVR